MGNVQIIHADCTTAMAELPACSVDACVTDPPYHLTSIVKRYGKSNLEQPADKDLSRINAGDYARLAKGFMGKQWDGGDVAFRPETWRLVWEALKPGAHLLAFGGTRTYHRMACAIEDAGFEIRDQIAWLYGSGFPKSHDVSKAIDSRRDWTELPKLQHAIRDARKGIGISQSEAARRCGLVAPGESLGGGGFMWFETGMRMPTRAQWPQLKVALQLGDDFDACFEAAEREVIGRHADGSQPGGFGDHRFTFNSRDITAPASDLAKQWEGWGTALKPALEPIVLARKPLIGTVAANVLAHGTGALNIDGCRVPTEPRSTHADGNKRTQPGQIYGGGKGLPVCEYPAASSRWPANVIHDGSAEVVEAFPEPHGAGVERDAIRQASGKGIFGIAGGDGHRFGDEGSAARFFYSAKADAEDRLGSKHPTVKPVDLIAYLCRLITPPGGTVLDPFAGSGTTGMACMREGFNAILIEREAEYVADIKRRLEHVTGADTPLFAGAAQ